MAIGEILPHEQQYFDFVELPAAKRSAAAASMRAAGRASSTAYSIGQRGGELWKAQVARERADALRAWQSLADEQPAAVRAAMDRHDGTISNLLHQFIRRELPHFDIRGAVLDSPADLAAFCLALRTPYFESLKIALVDDWSRVLHSEVVSIGSLNVVSATPQMLVRVLANGAAAFPHAKPAGFVCAHNHPSGITEPSGADRIFTARMEEVGQRLGVRLIDHVITNGKTYFSFREIGMVGMLASATGVSGRRGRPPAMTVLPTPPREDLADWEVRPGSELLAVDRTRKLVPYLETLRTADPGYHHVFHLNSQARLVAVERIPAAWTADQVIARVIQTSGRNGGDAIALGLDGHAIGDVLPFQRKLVANVGEGMAVAGIRFADAMMSLDDRYFSWLDAGLLKSSQSMPSSELEEDTMLEATLS